MDLFGRRRRADIERLEGDIAAIAAQLNCVQMIAFHAVKTMDHEEREKMLSNLREFVVKFGSVNPPGYVSPRLVQPYRDELSRVMQLFIETLGKQ